LVHRTCSEQHSHDAPRPSHVAPPASLDCGHLLVAAPLAARDELPHRDPQNHSCRKNAGRLALLLRLAPSAIESPPPLISRYRVRLCQGAAVNSASFDRGANRPIASCQLARSQRALSFDYSFGHLVIHASMPPFIPSSIHPSTPSFIHPHLSIHSYFPSFHPSFVSPFLHFLPNCIHYTRSYVVIH